MSDIIGVDQGLPRQPQHEASEATRGKKIESAQDPRIKESKLSMLSKPNQVTAVVPDLDASATSLEALGLQREGDRWYVQNREWFPNPLDQDSVIIDYGGFTDPEQTIRDIGFCSKDEFRTIYANPDQYKQGSVVYFDPDNMQKGTPIEAVKCATGEFTLVADGTEVSTNEGDVVVKAGQALIINEKKNSLYVTDIAKVLEKYVADPMNPASKKAFELLRVFQGEKGTKRPEELSQLFNELVEQYNAVPRNIRRHETYSAAYTVDTLRGEYQHAAAVVEQLDREVGTRIDSLNFDERVEQAKGVIAEIRSNTTLTEEERDIQISYIAMKLWPKTNNHQHLKGSIPQETLLSLAQRHGFGADQLEQIRASYARGAEGFDSLGEFNDTYGIIGSAVRTPQDYQDAVKGIIEEATREGQLTVEIRCAVIGQRDDSGAPLDPRVATENILQAMEASCDALGEDAPKTGFTFLGYRGRDWKPEEVFEHVRLAIEFAQKYPDKKFGFDIAGPEDTGYPPSHFREAFDQIKEYNRKIASGELQGETIGLTIHSGETPTYDNGKPGHQAIEEALDLGVDRIGHGVQAITNLDTLDRLAESGATVEICGVCNVSSIPINTEGMAVHPVDEFMRRGIPVTLCTDNDSISGTKITKEYMQFQLTGHKELMNWNNVKDIAKNGIQTSFVSESARQNALDEYNRRIRIIEKLMHEEHVDVQGAGDSEQIMPSNKELATEPSEVAQVLERAFDETKSPWHRRYLEGVGHHVIQTKDGPIRVGYRNPRFTIAGFPFIRGKNPEYGIVGDSPESSTRLEKFLDKFIGSEPVYKKAKELDPYVEYAAEILFRLAEGKGRLPYREFSGKIRGLSDKTIGDAERLGVVTVTQDEKGRGIIALPYVPDLPDRPNVGNPKMVQVISSQLPETPEGVEKLKIEAREFLHNETVQLALSTIPAQAVVVEKIIRDGQTIAQIRSKDRTWEVNTTALQREAIEYVNPDGGKFPVEFVSRPDRFQLVVMTADGKVILENRFAPALGEKTPTVLSSTNPEDLMRNVADFADDIIPVGSALPDGRDWKYDDSKSHTRVAHLLKNASELNFGDDYVVLSQDEFRQAIAQGSGSIVDLPTIAAVQLALAEKKGEDPFPGDSGELTQVEELLAKQVSVVRDGAGKAVRTIVGEAVPNPYNEDYFPRKVVKDPKGDTIHLFIDNSSNQAQMIPVVYDESGRPESIVFNFEPFGDRVSFSLPSGGFKNGSPKLTAAKETAEEVGYELVEESVEPVTDPRHPIAKDMTATSQVFEARIGRKLTAEEHAATNADERDPEKGEGFPVSVNNIGWYIRNGYITDSSVISGLLDWGRKHNITIL